MRRILLMALAMALAVNEVGAQVIFRLSDGIYNESLKTKVEQNISLFLTNVNNASRQGAEKVDLGGVMMTAQAKEAFDDLWEFLSFKCMDDTNVLPCIQTVTGYTVRGIPVIVTDKDTNEAPSVRELTIGFNSNGEITGVFFALEQHIGNEILHPGMELKDSRERAEILNCVERYRSYYEQKDLKSISEFFGVDLSSTETEGNVKVKEEAMVKKIRHDELNNNQYIEKLRNIFMRGGDVKVKFTSVGVWAHPTKKDIYMVRVHQNLNTQGFEDNGYVTMLWMFRDKMTCPQIIMCIWQSEESVKTEDDFFQIHDFYIFDRNTNVNHP